MSAGEWSAFALARAFMCESPVLVLDEPTSFTVREPKRNGWTNTLMNGYLAAATPAC